MKNGLKLVEVGAVIVVILFVGMTLQSNFMNNVEKSSNSVSENTINKMIIKQSVISNASNHNVVNSQQIKTKITDYNNVLSFLFTKWYLSDKLAGSVTFAKLNSEEKITLFHDFLNTSSIYKKDFNKLVNYESQLNGLQNTASLSGTGNSTQSNNYKELWNTTVTADNSSYLVTEYKSTGNIDHQSSFMVSYKPLGKNNLIDPDIMVQINPITINLGWFGNPTIGYQYNLYVTYHGNNAILEDQNLVKAINNVLGDTGAAEALFAGVTAAVVGLLSFGIGLAVMVAYVAAIAAVGFYCSSQDIGNLNSAFDSTYFNNGQGCLELGYSEVKLFYGTSNSFGIAAWDKSSNSWLSIVPTLPEYLSGFASTVQTFSNDYGNNNWVYVSQSPST